MSTSNFAYSRFLDAPTGDERTQLVKKLRSSARRIAKRRQAPVSVNDVRSILTKENYDGDPRILGSVFNTPDWIAVGWTTTNSRLAHARPIRTFALVS